jgi:catechol 2,3-dioxygenase-like lactoylglutathione lyase family enzyme
LKKYILFLGLIGHQLLSQTIDQSSKIVNINHVRLSVKDISKSTNFYKNVFNLIEQVENNDFKKNELKKQKIRDQKCLIGTNGKLVLVEYVGAENQENCQMPVNGPGITHVCYQAPQAKSIYEKGKTYGGKIVSRGNKPVDRGFGIHYAYAKDPDGILLEMEHFDKPPFATDVQFGHVALVTPDIDKLVKFYTDLLGVPPINRKDNIKNQPKLDDIADIDSLHLRGAWFKVGNMLLEMWQFDQPKTSIPTKKPDIKRIGYNLVSFETSDIKADYVRLKKLGFKFSRKIKNNKVLLNDIDGNLIELIELKKI